MIFGRLGVFPTRASRRETRSAPLAKPSFADDDARVAVLDSYSGSSLYVRVRDPYPGPPT